MALNILGRCFSQPLFCTLPSRLAGVAISRHYAKYTMPDPYEHATGAEKQELECYRQGIMNPYGLKPIKRNEGTKDNPNLIPSYADRRIVGCVCNEDSHSIRWMWVEKDNPKRCFCGYWFKLVPAKPLPEPVYQRLKWGSVDLSSHIVAAAPFGGPVAVMRDPRKTVRVSTQPIGKPQIVIYSACGEELGVIRWSSGTLIQLGWSSNDQLICVQDDGLILVYDLFGNYHHTCSMGNDAKEHHVSEARLFPSFAGTGLVILTNPGRFYAVVNVQEPKVKRFSQTPGVDRSVHPNAWTVFCEDRSLRIYAAYDRDVYRMDTNETVLLVRYSN
ncbi:unnamed protein product, partial [Cyprideis torosa]